MIKTYVNLLTGNLILVNKKDNKNNVVMNTITIKK